MEHGTQDKRDIGWGYRDIEMQSQDMDHGGWRTLGYRTDPRAQVTGNTGTLRMCLNVRDIGGDVETWKRSM